MPDEFIAVEIQGLDEISARLAKLPDAVGNDGVEEANKYLLDVLRQYPGQKSISRKRAYGKTFQSDKQRRFFFAALRDGRIQVPYRRTQTLRKGWRQVGSGKTSFIANETSYADLVMGNSQTRMHALIGWMKIGKILEERAARILEKFEVGVRKAIKRLGF